MFVDKTHDDDLFETVNKIKNPITGKMQAHFRMSFHFFMINMINILREPIDLSDYFCCYVRIPFCQLL